MGGGGGGYFSGRVNASELARQVRDAEMAAQNEAQKQSFNIEVNDLLTQALGEANNRDVEGTQKILDKIKADLAKEFEGTTDLMFGGSVAKKTYVEGLSDVDALVLLNSAQVNGDSPSEVRAAFAERLRMRFGDDKVHEGQLAVTLNVDGKSIQLLPAMRAGEDSFKISNEKGTSWATIRPRKFAEKLTQANKALDGKLVPTIKLAKAIIAGFPEQQQLSGYHVESLGINVFRDYTGDRTPKAMLRYFFEKAPDHVLSPIKDSTGQSIHVDTYLGDSNSLQRRIVSDGVARIGRKLANADAACSFELWKQVLNSP